MPATASYPFDTQTQGQAQAQTQEPELTDCLAENAKGQWVPLCRKGIQRRYSGSKSDYEEFPCPLCRPRAHAHWLNPPVVKKPKQA